MRVPDGASNLELLSELPVQYAPSTAFFDLYQLVPWLLELYPEWTTEDLESFVEEKTRKRVDPEDLITLAALHRRYARIS
ncbi:MAG: hypothetical protein WCG80_01100 [Spirochaetales bacterium]